ncbi:hypothetical protein BDV96DRAFT_603502 [Lophiotrema nucula]|uniref:Uncharacterized protein n=1 Tax=Lophiotrema nucula TaxID=690887 RepID=A0A6A5YVT7_9PLEO|nr:hypothetical protein BDV96DRAFT_603502 [Lophiotrema nucula]
MCVEHRATALAFGFAEARGNSNSDSPKPARLVCPATSLLSPTHNHTTMAHNNASTEDDLEIFASSRAMFARHDPVSNVERLKAIGHGGPIELLWVDYTSWYLSQFQPLYDGMLTTVSILRYNNNEDGRTLHEERKTQLKHLRRSEQAAERDHHRRQDAAYAGRHFKSMGSMVMMKKHTCGIEDDYDTIRKIGIKHANISDADKKARLGETNDSDSGRSKKVTKKKVDSKESCEGCRGESRHHLGRLLFHLQAQELKKQVRRYKDKSGIFEEGLLAENVPNEMELKASLIRLNHQLFARDGGYESPRVRSPYLL